MLSEADQAFNATVSQPEYPAKGEGVRPVQMKIRSFVVCITMAALAAGAKAQTSTTTNSEATKSASSQTSAAATKTGLVHDETLQGNGTSTAPLGVAFPLNLGGSLKVTGDSSVSGSSSVDGSLTTGGGIKANIATGNAIEVTGGVGGGPFVNVSGAGIKTTGGDGAPSNFGGAGVEAHG